MKRSARGLPMIERLLESSHLVQTERSVEIGDCFVWEKNKSYFGYGLVVATIDGRKRPWFTHRISWAEIYGPIPPGIKVLHHCDNPPCWRPDHLFLGTDADNALDKVRKGRWHLTPYIPITHCKHGHELTGTSVEFIPNKGRIERRCRLCHNKNTREYYARKKLEKLLGQQGSNSRT